MSPLAHVIQVAIVGGALVGVMLLGAGTAAASYFKAAARAASAIPPMCSTCTGEGILDRRTVWARVCPACDGRGAYTLAAVEDEEDAGEFSVEDDPGAEWDRARDRDLDFWGAA